MRDARWHQRLLVGVLMFSVVPAIAAPPKRLARDRFKNGVAIRTVFRPVVSGPSRTTVCVLVNERQKALGAIVGAEGWVVTKASELTGKISCRLKGGAVHPAQLVSLHVEHDLALLKISAKNLPVVSWKLDQDPLVGQWLATPGVTDVPEAVGVVSIRRRTIPRQFGFLGVGFEDHARGARVTQVMPDSGASLAGLKKGDVIIEVGGMPVAAGAALRDQIQKFLPGETLPLRVLRSKIEFDAYAKLGSRAQVVPDRGQFMNKLGGQLSLRSGGFPAAFAHDTVLKPEQCGGPLVNLYGQTVGINIARVGRTETHAIPAKVVKELVEELKTSRKYAAAVNRLGPAMPPPVPLVR